MYEHKLPALPYEYSALEPFIDELTMKTHHTKHHQAYVDKLNAALKDHPDLHKKSLEELVGKLESVPEGIRTAVRNHGGGNLNHTFFWKAMTGERQNPEGEIAEAVGKKFGGADKFKEMFSASAAGVFGSGWCWLVLNKGELEIITTPNQDSPLMQGKKPLLGLDVWEHAYYILYKSARSEYIKNWWNVVNWQQTEHNYKAALKA
jgi:Fe-Mn family superoxide dismutase